MTASITADMIRHFARNLAHEIRTPLGVVFGAVHDLRDGYSLGETELHEAVTASTRVISIINALDPLARDYTGIERATSLALHLDELATDRQIARARNGGLPQLAVAIPDAEARDVAATLLQPDTLQVRFSQTAAYEMVEIDYRPAGDGKSTRAVSSWQTIASLLLCCCLGLSPELTATNTLRIVRKFD